MTSFNKKFRSTAFYFSAVFTGLISVFFIFYTIRLLYITRGLTAINTGGQGAYIGAIAFPLLAVGFGFIPWCCVRVTRRNNP